MLVTEVTRMVLRHRKWRAAMEQRGFEQIGETGGMLWQIYRGGRQGQRITAVEIDPDGMSVWVKIEKLA